MSKEQIKIIKATEKILIDYRKDLLELIKISLINSLYKKRLTTEYVSNLYNKLLVYFSKEQAKVNIAFRKRKVVGFIWFFSNSSNRIHINYFAVKNNQQGKGIGKKLLISVEEYARYNNILSIELFVSASNSSAESFYINSNFVEEKKLLVKKLIKEN